MQIMSDCAKEWVMGQERRLRYGKPSQLSLQVQEMPSEGNGSKQKEGAWFIKEESYFFFQGKGSKNLGWEGQKLKRTHFGLLWFS